MRGPFSTRKHELRQLLRAAVRENLNACLISEAERLHNNAESGFDPSAYRLSVTRHVSQIWVETSGAEILVIWVWLSSGRKMRGAWMLTKTSEQLIWTLVRVPWPFKGDGHKRAARGS